MIQFETWFKTDMSKPIMVRKLTGSLYSGDSEANLIGVEVTDDGEPVTLSGGVYGYIIREDGQTVVVEGDSDGNRAWIVLPTSAYTVIGLVSIVIKVGDTTVGACSTSVYRTTTGTIVDPGTVVPDISELLAAVAACEAATEAAEAAADNAVIYSGSQSLTTAQKAQARTNIGAASQGDLSVLEPAATSSDVGKALIVKTVANGKAASYEFGEAGGGVDPSVIEEAVDDWLDAHPEATTTVEDGSITRVKIADGVLNYVTPEMFGAVGDGVTDDSEAVQDACDAGDDVYFASGKTYYLGSSVTVNKSIRLHGGKDTVIKTKTPSGGVVNEGIKINGTLKATTTLTTNYLSTGEYTNANCSNKLTLADMSEVEIGDLIQIRTTDTNQRYSYSRRYYYLGGIFKVVDKYNGSIYINRSMPFDITLSNNLTVYVYDAPVAEVENLTFESDLDSFGTSTYNALLEFKYCKDSVIRQCNLHDMKIGFRLHYCVNALVDGVQVAKSRWTNESGTGDGYGIVVNTCTNTIIERIVSLCSQGCVDMGGDEPNFDTYIHHCNLSSECRAIGLDMHDNSYNLIVEDCILGGVSVYGTAKINRCQFIKNNRPGTDGTAIVFRGSHDPRWAQLYVSNCEFDSDTLCSMSSQVAQDYVSSINSVIGRAVFEHCTGGTLKFTPSTDAYILSNTINYLELNDWKDCKEFYHDPNQTVKTLVIKDSTFTEKTKINKHAGAFNVDGIATVIMKNTDPVHSRRIVKADISGGQYVLPANIAMNVSSNDSSALYIVCGDNCASNVPADWHVGTVSGSSGSPISKTPNTTVEANLTVSNGKLVFTQPTGVTSNYAIYPQCMMQAQETSIIRISAKLKNIGETSGNSYRAYIAIIDPSTGNLTYRGNGTSDTATVSGAVISHEREVPKGYIAMAYLNSYNAVADSVTTFEEFNITLSPYDEPGADYTEYNGSHRTGDGSLTSVQGINNVMSTASPFHLAFDAVEERGLYIGTWQGGSY